MAMCFPFVGAFEFEIGNAPEKGKESAIGV